MRTSPVAEGFFYAFESNKVLTFSTILATFNLLKKKNERISKTQNKRMGS